MKKELCASYQPAIIVSEYNKQDGHFAPDSEVTALSIGTVGADTGDISAAVHVSGELWELPAHRLFDLTILALSALRKGEALVHPATTLDETVLSEDSHQKLRETYVRSQNVIDCRIKEIKGLLEAYF
jgi:hypothetical protein